MSTERLKQELGITAAPITKQPMTFAQLLTTYADEIKRALPKHMTGDRMARIALTEYKKNKELQKCSATSIVASIIIASQLGLEPGVMGQGYLVPFKGQCQFIPGWQGYVELVNRAGRASVWTGAIREGDTYSYHFGTHPSIDHQPNVDEDGGDFTFVYAVGWVKGASHPVIEVWSRAKVSHHLRQYNKVGERHYALQNENNFEMYGRKVALLQVIKYMPKSTELATAFGLDNAANTQAGQNLTVETAKDMAWLSGGDDDANGDGDPNGGGPAVVRSTVPVGEKTASERLVDQETDKKLTDLFHILNFTVEQRDKAIKFHTDAAGDVDYEGLIESLETQLNND
jgi:recombination protein RecT